MSLFPQAGPAFIPPEGDPDSSIAIVGEAGGAIEARTKRPWSGPAGSVLDQCLHGAGILRPDVYLTNFVKIQPKGNNIKPFFTGKFLTEEGKKWQEILREEINDTSANVIIAAGGSALFALTGRIGVKKWRGSILDSTICPNRKVIPIIHPASVIYGDFIARYFIVADLKRAKEESQFPEFNLPRPNLIIFPTPAEAVEYIRTCQKAKRVVFDIECLGGQVSCFSISYKPGEAMSISVKDYSVYDEVMVWQALAEIMGDEEVMKIGQNLIFDLFFIYDKNHIFTRGPLRDTMIAHHILYPDFPKGLDFLTSLHTKHPYYKDDGKQWKQIKDETTFARYSAMDAITTGDVEQEIWPELIETEQDITHDFTIRMFPPLMFMMKRGIVIDIKAKDALANKLREENKNLLANLHEIAGFSLNPNSPKQCLQYFYIQKGIKPYLSRITGKPTVDDKALQRLANGTKQRAPIKEARIIQSIRGNGKLLGTYLDIKIDEDGRFRCSYNPRGTTTGRLSSSKTIHGTGMNHQNLPQSFRRFLIPDEGYIFIELDKRQAEWVVVAYLAGDPNMIRVVEEGKDAHIATAIGITRLSERYLIAEAKAVGHSRDPEEVDHIRKNMISQYPEFDAIVLQASFPDMFLPRSMSGRQCGKHANHGLDYRMGSKRFAEEYEMEFSEADYIRKLYLSWYVNIESVFWASVDQQLAKDRTLTNCFGRRRLFLDQWGEELKKDATSFLPQSTVADLVNGAMIDIYHSPQEVMKPLELLLQGHDSLLMQYPLSHLQDIPKITGICYDYLDPEMEYSGRKFRIKTDMKIGFNWRDMVEVPEWEDLEQLASGLPYWIEKAREYHERSTESDIREIDSSGA